MPKLKPTQNGSDRPRLQERIIVPPHVRRQPGFWEYCVRTASGSRERAKAKGIPHSIDAYFIDQLMVDQDWKCAISGIPLEAPRGTGKRLKNPFAPSLDRIVLNLGYVPGNLRIVNNLVNTAMLNWGLDTFVVVAEAIVKKKRT